MLIVCRSLGRYSSEEDSDSDVKVTKKKENRRATMAAPIMQPPSVTTRRKSTRLNDTEVEVLIHLNTIYIYFVRVSVQVTELRDFFISNLTD